MQEFDTGVASYLLDRWLGVLFYHVSLKYQVYVCCNYCKLQKLNVWTICNHSVSSSSAVVYCPSILIVYGRRLFWRKGLLKGRSGQRRAWGGRDRGLVVFMFKISNWITLSYSLVTDRNFEPSWSLSVCRTCGSRLQAVKHQPFHLLLIYWGRWSWNKVYVYLCHWSVFHCDTVLICSTHTTQTNWLPVELSDVEGQ